VQLSDDSEMRATTTGETAAAGHRAA
jgi:hypothetical protein